MLEVNPNVSVDHLKRILPYRDPATLDRLVEGLREAGISENIVPRVPPFRSPVGGGFGRP